MKKNISLILSLSCLFCFSACSASAEKVSVTFYVESVVYEVQELNKGDFATKPNNPPDKIEGSCRSTFAFWINDDPLSSGHFSFEIHKIEKDTSLSAAYHDDCWSIE